MKKSALIILAISILTVITGWSQDTLVLQPGPEGKDAMFDDIFPDHNWGNSPKFECMAWTNSGVPGANRGVIDFDLSVIPPNAVILGARFSLYFVCLEPTYIPHTGENESYLQLIISEWDEETVTWNNQPSTTTEDQVFLPRSTDPEQDYTDIDVTLLISKMYNEPGKYHGLMLRLKNEEPYRCLLFAGCDYMDDPGFRPELEIIYMICDMPAAGFEYLSDGLTVYFQDTSRFSDSYFWTFGDGYYSDLPEPWHTYDTTGYYQVCLETRNICASDTACQMVYVDYSSAAEYNRVYFSVYPNPARDQLNLLTNFNGEGKFCLLDLSGKEAMKQDVTLNINEINLLSLDHIQPGIYIARIETKEVRAYTKVMIVN